MKTVALAILCVATTAAAKFDPQAAINDSKSGSTIVVPAGTYTQPIHIKKGITLKGQDAVFEIKSNQPAILIDSGGTVTLDGLTIQHRTDGKPAKGDAPYAVLVRHGSAVIERCRFIAPGSADESPSAIAASDRSDVTITDSRFMGFNYTISVWDGAELHVTDSVLLKPGHCGITIGSGAKGDVSNTAISGSRYHAFRCTGGTFLAKGNLIARNKNRGFYIGNRSAKGSIEGNVIIDNATGINVFARSKVDVENNVIVGSSYAGIAIVDSAEVDTDANIIVNNERGAVGFAAQKGEEPDVDLNGTNLFDGNPTEAEQIGLPSKTLRKDPGFKDADAGLFASRVSDMGLDDPKALQALWIKWQSVMDDF